jgi:hypothetical protein
MFPTLLKFWAMDKFFKPNESEKLICLTNRNKYLRFAYLTLAQISDVTIPVGIQHEFISSFYFIIVSYSLQEVTKFCTAATVFLQGKRNLV